MSDDLTRSDKQRYLRENVLDKGYSVEEFVGYMQGLKGNTF